MGPAKRIFIQSIPPSPEHPVLLRGWVQRLRVLGKTTFLILKDCSGQTQCVAASEVLKDLRLKSEDTVEIEGRVRLDSRAPGGFEVAIVSARVLNVAGQNLPFTSSSDIQSVALESLIEYRPLALRNPAVGNIFRVQAALLAAFRQFLKGQRFTEIITSKLVASGTEGGTNLFELKYFDRVAYLAQSPQFYKEHGVAGFERVYETGHVYRAEPHATSRHLTEYYSLDVEFGFIDGPEDVIQLERELLTHIFETLNAEMSDTLKAYRKEPLPSMLSIPCWEFSDCLELLRKHSNRTDMRDDLDPEAERQLCRLAEKETGVPAVFVLGFPLTARPFYTAPQGTNGTASSFDLLFHGIEITTGGQRLHRRKDLESALRKRGLDPAAFESHLAMFDLGMPPHGGFAIGLERLTAQVLNLPKCSTSCTLSARPLQSHAVKGMQPGNPVLVQSQHCWLEPPVSGLSATLPQSDCVQLPVRPLCDFYCQAIPPTRAKSADRQTRYNPLIPTAPRLQRTPRTEMGIVK